MIDVALTGETIAQFERDGFVALDRIIDDETLLMLRERFDALFSGEYESGLEPDEVNWKAGRDSPSQTRQICNAWKADRYVAGVILDSGIGRACATLGRWPGTRINQDNLFWKPPGGSAIGFHQDEAYERWVVPSAMVSCWIALDDTSIDGGSVAYVPGSHRWGEVRSDGEFHLPEEPLKDLHAAAQAADLEAPDPVPLIVRAGGGALHHGRVWHGSLENRSKNPRRSIVAHCMSSDARFDPREVGPIYGRYKRFGDDTMDESFFPIVWREDSYRSAFLDAYTTRTISFGGHA